MAGPAPKTDKWTARENTQGKQGIVLIVSGLVEVSSSGKEPVLTEASGGGGGKTLVLDLTIRSGGGDDLQVLMWKRATFSKDVSANHYDKVEIRWDGKTIATVKVLDDDEHHQHLTALTQAANKTAPKPKLPAPPKKKAPKKAPKKTAHPEPKKPAPTAKKKAPVAKKKAASAKKAKKRPAAAKKRAPAKKRGGAKKRSAVTRFVAAAKKMLRGAKKRPAAKKRASGAKKRRSAARRR